MADLFSQDDAKYGHGYMKKYLLLRCWGWNKLAIFWSLYLSKILFFFFLFWRHLWHAKVPHPVIKVVPQQ